MDQDHVVPLFDSALAILDLMRDGNRASWSFPIPKGGMFSESAMLAVLIAQDRDTLRCTVSRHVRHLGEGLRTIIPMGFAKMH